MMKTPIITLSTHHGASGSIGMSAKPDHCLSTAPAPMCDAVWSVTSVVGGGGGGGGVVQARYVQLTGLR